MRSTLIGGFLAKDSRQPPSARRRKGLICNHRYVWFRPATGRAKGPSGTPCTRRVYWVDINRFLIHRFEPETGNVRNWFFAEPVTALGLTDRPDTLIVALGSHVILWQPANDARADFANPERGRAGVRLNDGRPDPAGNFWVGSMPDNVGADGEDVPFERDDMGKLFRINPDGSFVTLKSGIGISNTFCWSPDGTLLLLRRYAGQRHLGLGLRRRDRPHRQRTHVLQRFRPRPAGRLGDGPRGLSVERALWRRLHRAHRARTARSTASSRCRSPR